MFFFCFVFLNGLVLGLMFCLIIIIITLYLIGVSLFIYIYDGGVHVFLFYLKGLFMVVCVDGVDLFKWFILKGMFFCGLCFQ